MPSRRDLFRGLKKQVDELQQPDVQVTAAEPRVEADIQSAPAAQLPAVIPPNLPHGAATERLAATLNPDIDRRALLRGAGAVAANASRIGRVAEALGPKEAPTAAGVALPKFEEIWKRGDAFSERALDQIIESRLDSTFDHFAEKHKRNPTDKEYKRIVKEVEEDVRANPHEYAEEYDYEPTGPRYYDYQLPGGENYRELLVKVPSRDVIAERNALIDEVIKREPNVEYNKALAKHHDLVTRSKEIDEATRAHNQNSFYSGSWDEPNVLGHLRMHDRDIPGVGKSLHLEELNSEWHQEGSKYGYLGKKVDTTGWTAERAPKVRGSSFGWSVKDAKGDVVHTVATTDNTPASAIKAAAKIEGERLVPDAPLKNEWPDYLLRRAIKEAVESERDAVSWTPGEHQLERYGLEGPASEWHNVPDDAKALRQQVETYARGMGTTWEAATPKQRALWEDFAKKNIEERRALGDKNIKERKGLVDFYNKHLVERANAIGKDYGTKVEHKAFKPSKDYVGPHGVGSEEPVRQAHKKLWDYTEKRHAKLIQEHGVKYSGELPDEVIRAVFEEPEYQRLAGDAKKATDEALAKKQQQTKLPVLRITPQLRKAVKDGSFSLLSDTGKPGAGLAALEHAPPFHSAVEKAVASAKMDKASPDQWLGWLRNQPGVRKEELEHLGLDKLPEAWKGKKSLTRDEVMAHAKDRAPRIEETWKNGTGDEHVTLDEVQNAERRAQRLQRQEPEGDGAAQAWEHHQELLERYEAHSGLVPDDSSHVIHVLKITPQLREAALRDGFPLFSDSGKPGAPLAALERAPKPLDPTEAALRAIKEALRAHPRAFEETAPPPAPVSAAKQPGPLGGLPGAREAFHEHIGSLIPEQEFVDHFFAGMHSPQIKMLYRKNGLEFSGPLMRGQDRIGTISREFNFNNGTAHHGFLELLHDAQGRGIAKNLLKNQIETYQRLGLNSVDLYADINVGSYAWAKYGFLPDRASWIRMAENATRRLQRMEQAGDIDPNLATVFYTILNNRDQRAVWDLVDHQGMTRKGDRIAKELTFDNGWDGSLDLYDPAGMARFTGYIKKGR